MKQTLTQRVKKIEKEIRQMNVVLDSHGTDLYHIRNSDPEPYTAMSSTGDCARCGHNHHTDDYVFCNCCNTNAPQPQPIKPQEDCECPTPTKIDTTNATVMPCYQCGRKIKSQEDVIEDIVIDLIIEAWDLGYKKDGKNRHLIKKYKDKILAIVKGE